MERSEMRGYMVTALIAFTIPTLGMATKVGRDEAIADNLNKRLDSLVVLIGEEGKISRANYHKLQEHLEDDHKVVEALAQDYRATHAIVERMEGSVLRTKELVRGYGEDIAVLKSRK
ncbi:hypothetical protein PVS_04 [Vibrio phage vB_VspS_VS-ABTNL-3]|nr:hypothetical protein PVS_04 [Vibrio phage vB_VspS_VS-ABTNL-3]